MAGEVISKDISVQIPFRLWLAINSLLMANHLNISSLQAHHFLELNGLPATYLNLFSTSHLQ